MACYLNGILLCPSLDTLFLKVPSKKQTKAGKIALQLGYVNFSYIPYRLRYDVLNLDESMLTFSLDV